MFPHNGQSAVDYLIACPDSVKLISNFKVHNKNVNSDHCPLTFKIDREIKTHVVAPRGEQLTRYIWDKYKRYEYLRSLQDPKNIKKTMKYFFVKYREMRVILTTILTYFMII